MQISYTLFIIVMNGKYMYIYNDACLALLQEPAVPLTLQIHSEGNHCLTIAKEIIV